LSPEKRSKVVRRGVPAEIRGEVWKKSIGNQLGLAPEVFNYFKLKADAARLSKESAAATGWRSHRHLIGELKEQRQTLFLLLYFRIIASSSTFLFFFFRGGSSSDLSQLSLLQKGRTLLQSSFRGSGDLRLLSV
jgi:hypothetical protein